MTIQPLGRLQKRGRSSQLWKSLGGIGLTLAFLVSLLPLEKEPGRSLTLTAELTVKDSIRGVELALETPRREPAVVSYPDTNVTRPANETRPFFILHVGPPKTATTTLQTELTKYGDQLIQDNYAYQGQVMRNPDNLFDHWHGPLLKILKHRECQEDLNQARIRGQEPPKCWKIFLKVLQRRRKEGRNIIISEEDFAIKYAHLDKELGRTALDWPSLKQALEDQGWEPIVVIGYRRLYEIMPSAKQQWDRWVPVNDGLVYWPPKGRFLQPLFPGVLKDARLYDDYVPKYIPRTVQWSYTDHMIKTISPYLPVRLLNIHDNLSIRSTFLCRVLPYAPKACHASQLDDETRAELHENKEESLFYDAIATEAASRGWFDKSKFDRHQVGLAIRDYFEQVRKGSPNDFPLLCPDTTQLQTLLARSLVKEEQILSRETAETMRDEHIAGFWKAVEKKKFCWIDVDQTLREPHWKEYFGNLVPPSGDADSSDDGEENSDEGSDDEVNE